MTKPHIYLVGGLEHEFHFPGLKPPTSVNNSGLLLVHRTNYCSICLFFWSYYNDLEFGNQQFGPTYIFFKTVLGRVYPMKLNIIDPANINMTCPSYVPFKTIRMAVETYHCPIFIHWLVV